MKYVRTGILFAALQGLLLCAAEADLSISSRKAFVRNEQNAFLKVSVKAAEGDLFKLELTGTIAGFPVETLKADTLASGETKEFCIPVETRLNVGKYPIDLTLKSEGLEKPAKTTGQLLIGPELHDQMMVCCCGYYPFHHHDIQKLGFTSAMQNFWRTAGYCDEMLFDGFRAWDDIPFLWRKEITEQPHHRMRRNGNPYRVVNVLHPEVQAAAVKLTRARGEKLADFPAIIGVVINNEMRDATWVSFDAVSREAFQKFAGFPIPQEAEAKDGVHYSSIPDFPISRVIPDNDPLLTFYKWFWKDGDGYNVLNKLMTDGYCQGFRRPVLSLYAPAVRVPPVWGSGGEVDGLYHWTYATPDPINIGINTSELQAMADGSPAKTISTETQIITYRSSVAPVNMHPDNEPAWTKEFPKASYVTLAPDMMRIAIWVQLSRHTNGILFHGLDSLLQNPHSSKKKDVGYQCTNHETASVVKDMLFRVVKPLGPVLKRVPEREREVAVLESFASAIFAQRSTWGWKGWPFEMQLALLWGNLAPKVVYDETILRDKLAGVKVLILPGCDVLTENVYNIISDFQKKGGILVGDRNLVPALTPDITLDEYTRIGDPEKDKAALQKIGGGLRDRLAPYYRPYVQTSNPDLVTWVRSSGKADYLFVVNDKRTFGDYFGPFGKVMEKSVDNEGTVTIRRADTAVIYDPVNRSEVPFEVKDGETVIRTVHDRNSIGKLFLLLPEKIGKVKLDMPTSAKKGETVQLNVSIETESGKLLKSIHPVQIDVLDSEGNATCDTTSAALEDGSYSQSLTIPLNAASGEWKIKVTDLASGKTSEKSLHIL